EASCLRARRSPPRRASWPGSWFRPSCPSPVDGLGPEYLQDVDIGARGDDKDVVAKIPEMLQNGRRADPFRSVDGEQGVACRGRDPGALVRSVHDARDHTSPIRDEHVAGLQWLLVST